MIIPELLSPAGCEDSLKAAVDCGADAVYLGYKSFGARANAVNFDDETLQRAVAYAHLYHVKVHVTVNTLIKPGEVEEVRKTLQAIANAKADAVIVQDLGVARIVKTEFPYLALHASTQMAVCTAQGAQLLKKAGYDRVVMARECSLATIQNAVKIGPEIETFVHGALCTAVSGRCLMSSMAGGRSGNRGRCAQPCRQAFTLNGQTGAWLSTRDLCLLENLPQLIEAGVASLKIEGRLKSAEYVAVVTGIYRKALDALASGNPLPDMQREREKLLQIFHRGGFTGGYISGAQDAALLYPDNVSHGGLPIGMIVSAQNGMAQMQVSRDLHDGDSLQFAQNPPQEMRYSGPDIPAGHIARLRLRPGLFVHKQTSVSRLSDSHQLEEARKHVSCPIPVQMHIVLKPDEPVHLCMQDDSVKVDTYGEIPQPALGKAITEETIRESLSKLGQTPFVLSDAPGALHVECEEGLHLSLSALNALRRDAAEKLVQERIRYFENSVVNLSHFLDFRASMKHPIFRIPSDTLTYITRDLEVLRTNSSRENLLGVFDPLDWREDVLKKELKQLPPGCLLRLPPQLSDENLQWIENWSQSPDCNIEGIWIESVGQLGLHSSLPVFAGEGIPVCNEQGVEALENAGISSLCLWTEWNIRDHRELWAKNDHLPVFMKAYGRELLMLLKHCPHRARLGLSKGHETCALCHSPDEVCGQLKPTMKDRRGYRFPLIRTRFSEGCEITVLGALPTDLRSYAADRKELDLYTLLHFTDEPCGLQLQLINDYVRWIKGETLSAPRFEATGGHWARGVQ